MQEVCLKWVVVYMYMYVYLGPVMPKLWEALLPDLALSQAFSSVPGSNNSCEILK